MDDIHIYRKKVRCRGIVRESYPFKEMKVELDVSQLRRLYFLSDI